jgi:hypothetical protein
VRRWWLLPLGIVIAVTALLALVRSGPARFPVAAEPPLDQIDASSRARLEAILREAEHAEPGQTR